MKIDDLGFKDLCNARDALKLLIRLGVLDGTDVIDRLYEVQETIKCISEERI